MKVLPFDRENLPHFVKNNLLADKVNISLAEVGSFEGSYARTMLDTFPGANMFLIDMWETAGNDFYYSIREGTVERAYEVALRRFGEAENVKMLKGKSSEIVLQFEDESLDFIYIDADHSYEGCLQDLNLWYPKVKKGGVIAGHDWDCNPGMEEFHKFGVEAAVRTYFSDRLHDISLTNEEFHKSWVLLK